MPEPAQSPDVLRSLRHLARGLSALFWGLPVGLLICFQTARTDWLHAFGILPPVATTGLLLYGLWQMRYFQPAERGWRGALERTQFLAAINLALGPFLYWWGRMPTQPLFEASVLLLCFNSLMFLSHLNLLLRRLGAMLADETLHQETRLFTSLNRAALTLTFALGVLYVAASHYAGPVPFGLAFALALVQSTKFSLALIVVLVLAPLAMTMALLWKAKEVILASVFTTPR
jgi:hypothetical protein